MLLHPLKNSMAIVTFALGLGTLGLCGCNPATTSHSTLQTTVNGRQIKASMDGSASILSQNDSTTINFEAGTLELQRDSATFKGEVIADIPADAKLIEVEYSGNTLTIKADGETLHSAAVEQ